MELVVAALGGIVVLGGVWGLGEMRGRGRLALVHASEDPAAVSLEAAPLAAPMEQRVRAVFQLGGVESKKLLLHPLLAALLGFSLLAALPYLGSTTDAYWVLGTVSAILAMGGFLAANAGALRSRAERTEELFGSLPTSAAARTAVHVIASAAGAAAAIAACFGVALLAERIGPGLRFGEAGRRASFAAVDLVMMGAFVGLFCVLGVAAARWLPSRLAAPLLALGLLAVLGQIKETWAWWGFPLGPSNLGAAPSVLATGWQVVYLTSLAVCIGALAVLRVGRARWVWLGFAGGVALTVVSGALRMEVV